MPRASIEVIQERKESVEVLVRANGHRLGYWTNQDLIFASYCTNSHCAGTVYCSASVEENIYGTMVSHSCPVEDRLGIQIVKPSGDYL